MENVWQCHNLPEQWRTCFAFCMRIVKSLQMLTFSLLEDPNIPVMVPVWQTQISHCHSLTCSWWICLTEPEESEQQPSRRGGEESRCTVCVFVSQRASAVPLLADSGCVLWNDASTRRWHNEHYVHHHRAFWATCLLPTCPAAPGRCCSSRSAAEEVHTPSRCNEKEWSIFISAISLNRG